FEAASLALGSQAKTLLDYFEGCRRKRNVIDYTGVRIATATEASLLHSSNTGHCPIRLVCMVPTLVDCTHARFSGWAD
ncbi:MAG: hypothetical protein ACLQMO_17290, partial [Acidobacteriaceae bacterium]